VEEPRRQRPVVGEQQKTAGVQIEPADRVEARQAPTEEARDRGPSLGVLERAHYAARLVKRDRPSRPRGRDSLAVDRDHVARGVGALAQLGDGAPVDADAPRDDEGLGPSTGRNTGRAQDLLEALAQ